MDHLVLSPPLAFVILFVFIMTVFSFLSRFSFKKKVRSSGEGKSYACGEDVQNHRIQPDYKEFFPFAFFFTLLHVVALTIATVPIETIETFSIAITYIIGAAVGLSILFRR